MCLGIVLFGMLCLWERKHQREQAYEAYKRDRVIVKTGTVLQADCSFDPTTNTVACQDLIVTYQGENGEDATRTFTFGGDASQLDAIPQIGSRVLVAWTKGAESLAYVASLD